MTTTQTAAGLGRCECGRRAIDQERRWTVEATPHYDPDDTLPGWRYLDDPDGHLSPACYPVTPDRFTPSPPYLLHLYYLSFRLGRRMDAVDKLVADAGHTPETLEVAAEQYVAEWERTAPVTS